MTQALQVLHSVQWHQPSKNERALGSSPHPGLPLLHTQYLVLLNNLFQDLVAHL